MRKKETTIFLISLLFILFSTTVFGAYEQSFDVDTLRMVAIPIHIVEFLLAFFICYMAIKFFKFTQPMSIFLYVYLAGGFFIIGSLVNFVLYFGHNFNMGVNFLVIFIAGRVALLGMLGSLTWLFWQAHKAMTTEQQGPTKSEES